MNTWSPLWSKIVDSSLWTEPLHVRVLFTTMLAIKDRDHTVRLSAFALARRANMTEELALDGLRVLMAPDTRRIEPQEYEGRRIEKVEGGWLVLNGQLYRDMIRAEYSTYRREYQRVKQSEYREKRKIQNPSPPEPEMFHVEQPPETHPSPTPEAPPVNSPVIPKLEEFEVWAMQKRTGHTPPQIKALYEFLVGNNWRDMKDRPLNPGWQSKYWLLTGEEYQRITGVSPTARDADVPLGRDGKPRKLIHPSSAGYKAPGAPGF